MQFNTDRRVALVTGAARRVGRAIALELARTGIDVAIHYNTSADEARQTVADIEAIGVRAAMFQADLTDGDALQALVDQTVGQLGGLNVLINNASAYEATPLATMTRLDWRKHLETNLVAPAMLAQAAWSHLRARPPGHVINICDISGERPRSNYLAYCASKSGLINLTHGLARTMYPDVFVNGISPGVVLLEQHADPAMRKRAIKRVPLAREGTPEDVAALVRFFVERNTYILGQVISIDGGRSIS